MSSTERRCPASIFILLQNTKENSQKKTKHVYNKKQKAGPRWEPAWMHELVVASEFCWSHISGTFESTAKCKRILVADRSGNCPNGKLGITE